jgi:hypothetical protein
MTQAQEIMLVTAAEPGRDFRVVCAVKGTELSATISDTTCTSCEAIKASEIRPQLAILVLANGCTSRVKWPPISPCATHRNFLL